MPRLIRLLVAMAVLACVAIAPAATTAASDPAAQMRKIITVKGMLKHENAFQRSLTRTAARAWPGRPGFDQSVDYVVKKLKGAGYKPVVQPFDFAFFQENSPPDVRADCADAAHVRGPGELRHDGLLGERRRHGQRQGGSRQPVPAWTDGELFERRLRRR